MEAVEAPAAPAAQATGETPLRRAAPRAPSGNREFLALPGSGFVVELAHGADRGQLDALRDSLRPARGTLYTLHMLREGADWWLLVWGSFDSIEAARAARSELPGDAPLNAGWPRRIAPLQAEAQRAGE